jgi:DNA-binding transcriptional ArsR family regulator
VDQKILDRRKGLSDEDIAKRRKAGADPVRMRILERCYEDRDWTAKELAVALGLGTNGLYYHLRILEDAQLIVPTAGRPGPKGIERSYRLADNQHVDWELDEDLVMLFASLLEAAKFDVTEAVYEARAAVEAGEEPPPALGVSAPAITTTRYEIYSFYEELRKLIAKYRTRAPKAIAAKGNAATLKFTYALRERPVPDVATDAPAPVPAKS